MLISHAHETINEMTLINRSIKKSIAAELSFVFLIEAIVRLDIVATKQRCFSRLKFVVKKRETVNRELLLLSKTAN